MKALKELKIGFISAYNLLLILIPTAIAASAFSASFFIATPEPLRVLAAGIAFIGMTLLLLVMIGVAAYVYGEKQAEA
jgi:hypothetical protein